MINLETISNADLLVLAKVIKHKATGDKSKQMNYLSYFHYHKLLGDRTQEQWATLGPILNASSLCKGDIVNGSVRYRNRPVVEIGIGTHNWVAKQMIGPGTLVKYRTRVVNFCAQHGIEVE